MSKGISPREVETLADRYLLKQPSINMYHVEIIDEVDEVLILGDNSLGQSTSIRVPKSEFDKIVDWYNKEQNIKTD